MIGKALYPSLASSPSDPIVLLHGWGFDRASMASLVEPLRALADVWCLDLPGFGESTPVEYRADVLADCLAEHLPPRAVLIGWSLGGVLAVDYAARYPERVTALATLATNARFVVSDTWPEAMAPDVNLAFNRGFACAPAATVKRFCALAAQGGREARPLARTLQQMSCPLAEPRADCWSEALEYLASRDMRKALAELTVPRLHLFGEADALVPVSAGPAVAGLAPSAHIEVVAGAGHALHLDRPDFVAARLQTFVREAGNNSLDKHWVARSFSRAAGSYDASARLQRQVGERLLSELPPEVETALDLGSGTGLFLGPLRERSGATTLVALDLAEGMLKHARRAGRAADAWVCGDAESLPLAAESIDLVFSSLAIQWCERLERLASELHRVLRPGGRLCLATLGEGTLAELQAAWQVVDGYVHVNRFVPPERLLEALAQAGFNQIQVEQERCVLYCDSLRALSSELKGLGAHNVNTGRPRGLTGRHRLAALEQAYERYRNDQGLPVTYQVAYVTATWGGV
ncbi:malonyl-ACP O-methyltransferase BioC [Gilvimarinus algae]|uniref:Malonyl-[acyl-carrier protein] O-methyltransferase n=1 Tax=Gilvimarinus algae TaxID=3058037 RepID=A0ABT8TIT2_9GAMM|nr:malonyl-ACP O-methyltransferase BioC [Gilvimarinus sp. SDUM040014]MDO3383394.1 malonyl-ACP O-methyltransferase BioC [Gilvimarinus sp. SDUM040014]